jgi:uncharacterized protein (DUF4415 family)
MSANKRSTRKPRIDRDDAPELTGKEQSHPKGIWKVGGRVVSSTRGAAALRAQLVGKSRVNIHLDKSIIQYFKIKADGSGYQTLINAALRQSMEDEVNSEKLRLILREELAALGLRKRGVSGHRKVG